MRGIAAILVMLYHFTLAFGLGGLHWRGHSYLLFYVGGPLAVDFFFMLSGFVLSSAYGERFATGMTIRSYTAKRLIRLYPMYAIGMVFGIIALAAAIRGSGAPIDGGSLAASTALSFALIPDYVGTYGLNLGAGEVVGKAFPLNPPGWSLFFEAIISLTLLPLWRCSTRQIAAIVGGAFLILVTAGFLVVQQTRLPMAVAFDIGTDRDNLLAGIPRAITGFYLGVLLYRSKWVWRPGQGILGWQLPVIVLFGLLALCLSSPYSARGLYPAVFILVLGPLLLIWGAKAKPGNPVMSGLSHWLGWLSFPIYCVHFPVGQLAFQLGSRFQLSPWTSVGLALFATIVIAAVTCKYIEEPVRAWLSQRQNSKRPATT